MVTGEKRPDTVTNEIDAETNPVGFYLMPVPKELLFEIGIPVNPEGKPVDVVFQFTVEGHKLIVEQVTEDDFTCDGNCLNCPFCDFECDDDCENCPCSEECEESEED